MLDPYAQVYMHEWIKGNIVLVVSAYRSYRLEMTMINTKLIAARKLRGWTQTYLAARLAVTSITVSRWENGSQVPQAYCIQQLCQLFGMTDRELGFAFYQKKTDTTRENEMVYEKMDRFFAFGKLKTSEIILDGDGTGLYLPEHIRTNYIPIALDLPDDIQERKARISHEQAENEANGDHFQWNGDRYNLSKFRISREPANESMTLGLWFRPSDYYTFLATSQAIQEPAMREKYLAYAEWDEAIALFAHSFSVLLSVVTADGYTILVQRGKAMGCRPNVFDVSVAEGLSRSLDRSATSQAPDIYRCALRGMAEELGLHSPTDFSRSDIHFLSFAVDTQYCMWGMFGMVKLQKTLAEVTGNMKRGVQDGWENREIFSAPFTPEDVCSFVFEHQPFSPGGLVCLYHSLVHEFGHEYVDRVIASYS